MPGTKMHSRTWGDKAKKRFLSQHGTLDVHELPQTDAHAIKEYDNPVQPLPPTPEEQKAAEALLEAEIQKLRAASPPAHSPAPKPQPEEKPKEPEKKVETKKEEKPKNSAGSFYDEWID